MTVEELKALCESELAGHNPVDPPLGDMLLQLVLGLLPLLDRHVAKHPTPYCTAETCIKCRQEVAHKILKAL